jgi:hypothetical protein
LLFNILFLLEEAAAEAAAVVVAVVVDTEPTTLLAQVFQAQNYLAVVQQLKLHCH